MFVVENLQTGLAIPDVPGAVVFMSLGYNVNVLARLPWIGRARCIYWGDLDTHGFAILHRARSYLPDLQSILMDEDTLLWHRELWVDERKQHPAAELTLLTEAEQAVYRGLKQQRWGQNVRLEQERVAWNRAISVLMDLPPVQENVRARIRAAVKRLLRRYGYPQDKAESASWTVLEQAATVCSNWAEEGELPAKALAKFPIEALVADDIAATVSPPASAAVPPEPATLPFRVLDPAEARPYENCIPLFSLRAAAGHFSGSQAVEPEAWVVPGGRTRPGPGLFVAQVVGESMNRRIPNGAHCVFRAPVVGSRQGKVVLVQHRDIADPDHGGQYTVKVYESTKAADGEDGWRHIEIRLKPDTDAPGYEPIVLRAANEGDMRVIAELVEVLG